MPLKYQTYDFGDSGYRQTLPVPPPDGRAYQCPSKSLQFPDQTVPQEFQPFTGGPTRGRLSAQAGPVTDLWMLGSTNPAFLSNDPDTRTNASSYIPQTLYSAMFSDPVNEDIFVAGAAEQAAVRPRRLRRAQHVDVKRWLLAERLLQRQRPAAA